MLAYTIGRCQVEVRFSCFALLAFCCIFAGMDGSASFLLAVSFHEAAHLAAMWRMKVPPEKVILSALGCRVEPGRGCLLTDKAQALISLAGPGVNLLLFSMLLAAGHSSTPVAGANLALGIVHSLPVEPLDGGLALHYLLRSRLGVRRAETVSKITSAVFIFPLAVLGFLILLRTRYNYSLLALSVYLMLYLVLGKDDTQA